MIVKEVVLRTGDHEVKVFVNEQDGEQWVAVSPLCRALGIAENKQHRRIRVNPQFKVRPYGLPSEGGAQETLCIPVRQVGMWICTINANKVSDTVRDKLITFQEHLQVAIHDHLTGRVSLEVVTKMMETMENMGRTILQLQGEVAYLKAGQRRFELSERRAAGSRLSQERWAKRDRKKLLGTIN